MEEVEHSTEEEMSLSTSTKSAADWRRDGETATLEIALCEFMLAASCAVRRSWTRRSRTAADTSPPPSTRAHPRSLTLFRPPLPTTASLAVISATDGPPWSAVRPRDLDAGRLALLSDSQQTAVQNAARIRNGILALCQGSAEREILNNYKLVRVRCRQGG